MLLQNNSQNNFWILETVRWQLINEQHYHILLSGYITLSTDFCTITQSKEKFNAYFQISHKIIKVISG